MDSFTEPYTRLGDDISLEEVRKQVKALEDEHRAHGIPLSGRILHVCHYLPVNATLNNRSGVISPPLTPPPAEAPLLDGVAASGETKESKPTWSLTPRYGHAAMISGIRSLSATHEQLIIGWTGDINSPVPGERISEDDIADEDKAALEEALKSYQPKESDPDDDKKTSYVPVWLNDQVAHGHYDGYCKQSKSFHGLLLLYYRVLNKLNLVLWPLFHYLLWQDVATEYASADSHYPFYESANAAFARRIAEVYKPGDLIWVHDYHLLLLPKLVREFIPEAVLGLFVHTPFPSSEVFRCLPSKDSFLVWAYHRTYTYAGRKEILDGMLGANLICFQVKNAFFFFSHLVNFDGYGRLTLIRDISPRRVFECAATKQMRVVLMLRGMLLPSCIVQ